MSLDLILALALFALVSSVTPGPNNLMLMASGANFGLRRTLPHMLGVALGFTLMVALVGAGVGQLFQRFPLADMLLKVFAVVYLLYLAWKIATAAPPERKLAPEGRPFTFLQAAAFQWVNPKAWAMALTATTAYAPDRSLVSVLLVAAVFGLVNLPSVGVWTILGREVARLLRQPRHLRAFNLAMAALLVASLWPILTHHAPL
ncbi:LysE family translocator [Oceaniglobus roseus]|uniref:LysE family translocator n=1 Tax=Oceaniglobus roseus TaxID=1737570 RepID=UPI000C7EA3DA|nr:LysE family translocator [Kandeliimicrobium roseum]